MSFLQTIDPAIKLAFVLGLLSLTRGLWSPRDTVHRTTDLTAPIHSCNLADLARLGQIELNCATEEALAALPGVGPALAAKIVAWRGQRGPYQRGEDLLAVPGFGKKRVKRITPYLHWASKNRHFSLSY